MEILCKINCENHSLKQNEQEIKMNLFNQTMALREPWPSNHGPQFQKDKSNSAVKNVHSSFYKIKENLHLL